MQLIPSNYLQKKLLDVNTAVDLIEQAEQGQQMRVEHP